jgi:glutaredoxin 3
MPKIVMYCTATCPYCIRAEQLLLRKGVTRIDKIRVDEDPTKWDELMDITHRDTVPQIFIDGHHVGGYDDLVDLDLEGGLEPLLAKS